MIIVSSFKLNYNTQKMVYTIEPNGADSEARCPLCGGTVSYRDSKGRNSMNLIGEVRHFSLRRLRCKGCNILHTETPDIIQPYKHYDSHTIQAVLDGSAEAEDCVADDSTIRRWKAGFAEAEPEIEQRLASVYARAADGTAPILTMCMPLSAIRSMIGHWLAFVTALLINNGHRICTRFAFVRPPFACILGTEKNNKAGGYTRNDKTTEDTR
jgi:hypothetical protein